MMQGRATRSPMKVARVAMFLFFFFQAEDGIRDVAVTGVQTCALPISSPAGRCTPRVRTTSRIRTGFRSSCRTTVTRLATGTSGSGNYGSSILPILAALAIVLSSDSIPAIVPRPAHVAVKPGAFALTAGTVIATDRALRGLGELLGDYLFPATSLRLAVRSAAPAGTSVISLHLDSSPAPLRHEGYRLR